ncbi:conserved hypothetical protein [Roseovarius sp. EC-HK134]|jgi:hypothetical protein|nr:conserved hypothetical protein [Roseovarius sp. EC-SD190]VVS99484.1 conserved hypothetical protein [Roseovarius sp. EC-HK134]
MHPMIFHQNHTSLHDDPVLMQGGGMWHRTRAAYESWKRFGTIPAFKPVNDRWLRDIGILRRHIRRISHSHCGVDSCIFENGGAKVGHGSGGMSLLRAA